MLDLKKGYMRIKKILINSLSCLIVYGCAVNSNLLVNEKSVNPINEKLGHPFGTILNVKVEIVNGENTMKATQSLYLMKVVEVNNETINDTIIMTFTDETEEFPIDGFELHRYVYGKEANNLSSAQKAIMEKNYVGKKFDVIAYETGGFEGMPKGYFDYQPIKQGTGFYFKHYLVIISTSNAEK